MPFRRVNAANFREADYLEANPDVAEAVAAGVLQSGRHHFELYGLQEGRRARPALGEEALRAEKMARLRPLLKLNMPHKRRGEKYDFLTPALRTQAGVVATENVSSNAYEPQVLGLIRRHIDGLVLDCGAGRRPVYHRNVVNFDIADYDSTDVVGIGEHLPFKDHSFDAVISLAVLEHVRDPFACAREICRVLKPGGELLCGVPFLQPRHGYPNHYFNMAPEGLRLLFERELEIQAQEVTDSSLPIWTLTWIIRSWAAGLQGDALEAFLSLSVIDLLEPAHAFINRNWVRELPTEVNFELACGTLLSARKPLRKRPAAAKAVPKPAAPRKQTEGKKPVGKVSSAVRAKPPLPPAPVRKRPRSARA